MWLVCVRLMYLTKDNDAILFIYDINMLGSGSWVLPWSLVVAP